MGIIRQGFYGKYNKDRMLSILEMVKIEDMVGLQSLRNSSNKYSTEGYLILKNACEIGTLKIVKFAINNYHFTINTIIDNIKRAFVYDNIIIVKFLIKKYKIYNNQLFTFCYSLAKNEEINNYISEYIKLVELLINKNIIKVNKNNVILDINGNIKSSKTLVII
jgi:hypothetical protein